VYTFYLGIVLITFEQPIEMPNTFSAMFILNDKYRNYTASKNVMKQITS
jgi:hypothetical protein